MNAISSSQHLKRHEPFSPRGTPNSSFALSTALSPWPPDRFTLRKGRLLAVFTLFWLVTVVCAQLGHHAAIFPSERADTARPRAGQVPDGYPSTLPDLPEAYRIWAESGNSTIAAAKGRGQGRERVPVGSTKVRPYYLIAQLETTSKYGNGVW